MRLRDLDLLARWLPDPLTIGGAPAGGTNPPAYTRVASGIKTTLAVGIIFFFSSALILLPVGLLARMAHLDRGGLREAVMAFPALSILGYMLLVVKPLMAKIVNQRPHSVAVYTALAIVGVWIGHSAMGLLEHPIVHQESAIVCRGCLRYHFQTINDSPSSMFGFVSWVYLFVSAFFFSWSGAMLLRPLSVAKKLASLQLPFFRLVSTGVILITTLVVVLGLAATARRGLPTLRSYLQALPVQARLAPQAVWQEQEIQYAGKTVARFTTTVSSYRLHLIPGIAICLERLLATPATSLPKECFRDRADAFGAVKGRTIFLRRDGRRGLLLLEAMTADSGKPPEAAPVAAFRQQDLRPVAVTPLELASRSGPPPFWLLSALVGLALALRIVASRRHWSRLLARGAEWQRGVVDEQGRILIANGAPLLPAAGEADWRLAAGAVVILPDVGAPDETPYRLKTATDPVLVVPGTVEAWQALLVDAAAGRGAFACAVISLLASPLMFTAADGFIAWWP